MAELSEENVTLRGVVVPCSPLPMTAENRTGTELRLKISWLKFSPSNAKLTVYNKSLVGTTAKLRVRCTSHDFPQSRDLTESTRV